MQDTKEDERHAFTSHVEGLVAVCTAFLEGRAQAASACCQYLYTCSIDIAWGVLDVTRPALLEGRCRMVSAWMLGLSACSLSHTPAQAWN